MGRRLWRSRFRDRAAFIFCDNEAARSALVAGYSADAIGVQILSLVNAADVSDGTLTWHERVPTASNPADQPSRMLTPTPLEGWNVPVELEVTEIVDQVIGEIRTNAASYLAVAGGDAREVAPGVV